MPLFKKRLDKNSCSKERTYNNEVKREAIMERFNNAVSNIVLPPKNQQPSCDNEW